MLFLLFIFLVAAISLAAIASDNISKARAAYRSADEKNIYSEVEPYLDSVAGLAIFSVFCGGGVLFVLQDIGIIPAGLACAIFVVCSVVVYLKVRRIYTLLDQLADRQEKAGGYFPYDF